MGASSGRIDSLVLMTWLCVTLHGSTAIGQLRVPKTPQPDSAKKQIGMPILDKIELSVDSAATGDALKLQQEIASQFARQSFCPPERMKEYAWVEPRPPDGRIGLWLTGWWGIIEKTTKTQDGCLVRVTVEPRFANGGHAVRRISDGSYCEVYRFVDGALVFLEAVAPPNGGRPLVITW